MCEDFGNSPRVMMTDGGTKHVAVIVHFCLLSRTGQSAAHVTSYVTFTDM